MGIMDRMKKGLKDITGQTVEEKVAEFGEVYGEILLGVDREVEGVQRKVEHLQGAVREMEGKLQAHSGQLNRLESNTTALKGELLSRITALQEQQEQVFRRVEKLEESVRCSERRTVLLALAAAVAGALVVEGVLLWIRN